MTGNELLKVWAAKNGRTQKAMAAAFGISSVYVWKLLAGRASVAGLDLAARIERETGGDVPASSWLAPEKQIVRRSARRSSRKTTDRV